MWAHTYPGIESKSYVVLATDKWLQTVNNMVLFKQLFQKV